MKQKVRSIGSKQRLVEVAVVKGLARKRRLAGLLPRQKIGYSKPRFY